MKYSIRDLFFVQLASLVVIMIFYACLLKFYLLPLAYQQTIQ